MRKLAVVIVVGLFCFGCSEAPAEPDLDQRLQSI
jgi:uncharacterized protein YcfL